MHGVTALPCLPSSIFVHLFCFTRAFLFIIYLGLGLRCCEWAFLWSQQAVAPPHCGVRASRCGASLAVESGFWGVWAEGVAARGPPAPECGSVVCHAGLAAQHVGASRTSSQAPSPGLVSGFSSARLPGKSLFVHLEHLVVSTILHNFPSLGD